MQKKLFAKLIMLSVNAPILAIVFIRPVSAETIGTARELNQSPAQEVSMSLTRLAENHRQYSLVFSDSDEHVVSGTFSVEQLQILRAIMSEALKFAWDGADARTKDPVTTRFADKDEPAFIVDVQKLSNQSLLFFTITTESGRMTVEAGKVIRSTRREDGVFFDLLARLDVELPKTPAHPPR